MALDFGSKEEEDDEGSFFPSRRIVAPTGYRSDESDEIEKRIVFSSTQGAGTWETAYTVTTGKTLYITDVMFRASANVEMAMGFEDGGEITIIQRTGKWVQTSFNNVPLIYSSGENVRFFGVVGTGNRIIIIGFEQ